MRKSTRSTDTVIKIVVAAVLLLLTIWLCASRESLVPRTCVNMPEPEETASEFFDALIDGRYEDCDALLSNYTSLGLTSSTDTIIGEQLFSMLSESYSYRILTDVPVIVSGADIAASDNPTALAVYSNVTADDISKALAISGVAGKDASVAVAFTYLDISSMSDDLHEMVTEIAYGYAYESIDVNNEETASRVVAESLIKLDGRVEKYYRTDVFVINMKYDDGEWKIILDEALYRAIIGNIA